MDKRAPVTAQDLDAAVTSVTTALRQGADRDWSLPAAGLEWSCRVTAEHAGHCLLAYAAQLAFHAQTQYVRFVTRAEYEAAPADLLEFLEAAGRILAVMVRASAPDTRAFHPSGMSDPEGFAGMGCVEILLHGHDIATGLGLAIDPPREVCEHVISRMFPDVAADPTITGHDSWVALQWATGRATLPDRPDIESWTCRGVPLPS